MVASGETTKTYTFPSAYAAGVVPNVVVTPTGDPGGAYWVSDITATGFTIHLSTAAPADIKFNFQAQQ